MYERHGNIGGVKTAEEMANWFCRADCPPCPEDSLGIYRYVDFQNSCTIISTAWGRDLHISDRISTLTAQGRSSINWFVDTIIRAAIASSPHTSPANCFPATQEQWHWDVKTAICGSIPLKLEKSLKTPEKAFLVDDSDDDVGSLDEVKEFEIVHEYIQMCDHCRWRSDVRNYVQLTTFPSKGIQCAVVILVYLPSWFNTEHMLPPILVPRPGMSNTLDAERKKASACEGNYLIANSSSN